MKVVVYVEGPADRSTFEQVFDSWRKKNPRGARLSFIELNGKDPLLQEVGRRAARILEDDRSNHVFAAPDLYPYRKYTDTPLAHKDAATLRAVLRRQCSSRRFHPHCLVHDLECLLLASPDGLKKVLKTTDKIEKGWTKKVESQDHDRPPKRVVMDLFLKHRQEAYRDTIDARNVLSEVSVEQLQAKCPVGFGAFAKDLGLTLGFAPQGD